jgi:hypothetical protein
MSSSLEALVTPSARFHRGDNRASSPSGTGRAIASQCRAHRPLRIAIRRSWQNQSAKRCIASPGRHSLRNGGHARLNTQHANRRRLSRNQGTVLKAVGVE